MINLYILYTCPYCKKVISFMEENHLDFNLLDINEQVNFEKLIKIGGKRQVPYMVDTETNISMYESNDIIEYLKKWVSLILPSSTFKIFTSFKNSSSNKSVSTDVIIVWVFGSIEFNKKFCLKSSNSASTSSKRRIGLLSVFSFKISNSASFKDKTTVLCWPWDAYFVDSFSFIKNIISSLCGPTIDCPLLFSISFLFSNSFLKFSEISSTESAVSKVLSYIIFKFSPSEIFECFIWDIFFNFF